MFGAYLFFKKLTFLGWLKDTIDQEYGPDWQVIVGKQGSFGSCLSPMAGHYINFSIDATTFLIFRAN